MNYRLAKDRLECRVTPVGCVAVCFTSSREFRGAVELYGLKELRPDVGFVEAEQDVRDLCLPWGCALSGVFMS